jgi:hypothetical protein
LDTKKLLIIKKQEIIDGVITIRDISRLKLYDVAIIAKPAIVIPFMAIKEVHNARLI